jgi:hypothetical protein
MKIAKLILLTFLIPFFCFSQNRYDVIIDEVMADPSPQVGLPDNEWIELKNITSRSIDLQGWHINDASGQSGSFPHFILQPDSLVIVCTGSAAATISAFGTTISVTSFPSLDNSEDHLSLTNENGSVIHAVFYSDKWYQNELKKEGGWSLEMIDTKTPCAGSSNWMASNDAKGGTPGKKNSVDAVNNDQTPPKLKYVYTTDSLNIVAVFDEPLDSLSGATVNNYSIDGGMSFSTATTLAPLFDRVELKLNTPLSQNGIYNLIANNVTDCAGNLITGSNQSKVGLPSEALPLDMVINEILYNPRSNGYDYVEFYNRSNKIFDASKLFAANRNSNGDVSSIEQIFSSPFYIFPGDYFVITENAASLELNYLVKNPDAVLELSSLPSYPDGAGDVVLLNGQGTIVDEVKYDDGWQFKLIDNSKGVSLERIDTESPTQDAANWHSAASTAGYGTPSYQNSQYKQTQINNATIVITPKIFSPDNDGHNDVTSVQYKVTEPGYVANVTIYDSQGNPVRNLVKNAILGVTGQWNWDGLDEKGNRLPIGTYIVYTEIFNLQGKTQHFKNVVVLARRLN